MFHRYGIKCHLIKLISPKWFKSIMFHAIRYLPPFTAALQWKQFAEFWNKDWLTRVSYVSYHLSPTEFQRIEPDVWRSARNTGVKFQLQHANISEKFIALLDRDLFSRSSHETKRKQTRNSQRRKKFELPFLCAIEIKLKLKQHLKVKKYGFEVFSKKRHTVLLIDILVNDVSSGK